MHNTTLNVIVPSTPDGIMEVNLEIQHTISNSNLLLVIAESPRKLVAHAKPRVSLGVLLLNQHRHSNFSDTLYGGRGRSRNVLRSNYEKVLL
jgi:hypothetical protein